MRLNNLTVHFSHGLIWTQICYKFQWYIHTTHSLEGNKKRWRMLICKWFTLLSWIITFCHIHSISNANAIFPVKKKYPLLSNHLRHMKTALKLTFFFFFYWNVKLLTVHTAQRLIWIFYFKNLIDKHVFSQVSKAWWPETVEVGICDFLHWTRRSIRTGGSTAPYLIKQLSVWDKTERGMEGTEGRENIDGQASTSGLSRKTDRGVIGCQTLH